MRRLMHRAWLLALGLGLAACQKAPESPPPIPQTQPPASQDTAAPQPADPKSTAQLMARANAAFAANRWVAPPGDNALELFVLLQESGERQAAAQEALVELFPIAVRIAKADVQSDRLDEAERILNLLERATPNSLAVLDLRNKLLARRQALSAPPAPQPTAPAAPVPVLKPESATQTAAPVPAKSPDAPQQRPNQPPADTDQAATAKVGTTSNNSPAPTPDAGSPTAPAAAVSDPKVLSRIAPEYPAIAKHRRIEGWVELEFTVGVDGRATDIRVLQAMPSNVFNTAATRALARWKFLPAQRNGRPEAKRTRTRINFQLS